MFDKTPVLILAFSLFTLPFGAVAWAQQSPASETQAPASSTTPAAAAAARARVAQSSSSPRSSAPTGTAEESETPASASGVHDSTASRAGIGLVAAAGLHTGLALGARLGLGEVGLELEGGYQPIVAIWQNTDWSSGIRHASHVDLGSSGQLAAELYATPWRPQKSSAIGLKGGYRYNSMLRHGFAVAVTYLIELSDHFALEGLAGGSFFPGSEHTLRRKLGLPSDSQLVYTSSAQFFEYGFELIYYP